MATPIPINRAPFTVDEIAAATGGRVLRGGEASVGVVTDSRAPLAGAAFVALAGERFDAHTFVASATAAGARTVVVSRDDVLAASGDAAVVRVDDTRIALGALGRAHRTRWGAGGGKSLVAITGSAGKTTTRAVLAALLEAAAPSAVHASLGNLNNEIGVPMSLLGLEGQHRYAVIEVGTSARGEIAKLASIALPDVAVLTLVAAAHTAGIGSIDDVAVEKGALFGPLTAGGLAVASADDRRALAELRRAPAVAAGTAFARTFGFAPDADYRVESAASRGASGSRLRVARAAGTVEIDVPLLGRAGALAVAASLAVAEWLLGRALLPAEISAAFAGLPSGAPGRLDPLRLSDGTLVIDDSYNANPASMEASILAAAELASYEARRLVLVLGEMRELGGAADAAHDAIGLLAAGTTAAAVIGIGAGGARIAAAAGAGKAVSSAADADGAVPLALAAVRPGDVVLVKGSRGVATEKIVRALVGAHGGAQTRGPA